ncbi:hypothetical protein ACP70R_022692 [Stipagrostis hirtigluma subsp. patula]
MALSKPCAMQDRCIGPPPAAFGASVLPLDAWYDILLRLPAKELCRLRAVCRPWRRLLSDPRFVATHGARHSAPLFVVGQPWYSRGDTLLDIMDLSGNVIKRFRKTAAGKAKHEWAMASAPSDLVTVGEGDNITRPLDPSSRGRWRCGCARETYIFRPDWPNSCAQGAPRDLLHLQ